MGILSTVIVDCGRMKKIQSKKKMSFKKLKELLIY